MLYIPGDPNIDLILGDVIIASPLILIIIGVVSWLVSNITHYIDIKVLITVAIGISMGITLILEVRKVKQAKI